MSNIYLLSYSYGQYSDAGQVELGYYKEKADAHTACEFLNGVHNYFVKNKYIFSWSNPIEEFLDKEINIIRDRLYKIRPPSDRREEWEYCADKQEILDFETYRETVQLNWAMNLVKDMSPDVFDSAKMALINIYPWDQRELNNFSVIELRPLPILTKE